MHSSVHMSSSILSKLMVKSLTVSGRTMDLQTVTYGINSFFNVNNVERRRVSNAAINHKNEPVKCYSFTSGLAHILPHAIRH